MTTNRNTEKLLKKKLIKRILAYSEIYTVDDITELTVDELLDIQDKCLIKLTIRSVFRNRLKK